MAKGPTADEQLADDLSGFYADPLGYVMYCFPWDTDPSIQQVELSEPWKSRYNSTYGPDVWACEFLDQLAEQIKERGFDGRNAVLPIKFSTASGHGIGKSVLVAWLIKFILDTRPYSKGVVTAGTAEQLRTKTWAELGKWHKLSLTKHWFEYTSGRGAMSLMHRDFKENWRCDAQTCREENSESFAGLHAANSTPFYIFDEASAVPDKIFEVREGGTTDGEPMVFDFGNPTKNSGMFFENTSEGGRFKKRYIVRTIDSRQVRLTNKERIGQWIDDYGEESDYVKVRVRGMFPATGSAQFMATDKVEEAMLRELTRSRTDALVIGVDVARFGEDESVIWPRIGPDARSFAPTTSKGRYRKLDTVQLTGKVIECVREFRNLGMEYSMIFVDEGGIGGAVVDQLRHLGYRISGVNFGSTPIDAQTYRFKSDEMWGNLRDAIARNLCLPDIKHLSGNDIKTQLTQREFGYTLAGNKVHLETKADMKERLGVDGGSPDLADALALTFAQDVAPLSLPAGGEAQSFAKSEYDPLESKD